jgi:hypothetical protein
VNTPQSLENDSPWPRCPEAAQWLSEQLEYFCEQNPIVFSIAERLQSEASVLLFALVDHWILPENADQKAALGKCGFLETQNSEGDIVWEHPAARLPRVRFKAKRTTPCLAIGLESIEDFAQAHNLSLFACHGDNDANYRCGHVELTNGELMLIERRGYTGFAPANTPENLSTIRERLAGRNRAGEEQSVIVEAGKIIANAIAMLERGRAVDEFFAAERAYYLAKNSAARWQAARQESVGIGWSNHDHHTYRSSRESFQSLTQLFNQMGFISREQFYAGDEAGWGAQIFEHPESRVVIFADVDMAPEELGVDFATTPLPLQNNYGTIGLWCALHGSSIAAAGMHHLECEFDFVQMHDACVSAGIGVMPPFTNLAMLKQAFTVAEKWQVQKEKTQFLVSAGVLTREQADIFCTQGAPGSHLEILQRWEGFKGFNKTGISGIIRDTDARGRQAGA